MPYDCRLHFGVGTRPNGCSAIAGKANDDRPGCLPHARWLCQHTRVPCKPENSLEILGSKDRVRGDRSRYTLAHGSTYWLRNANHPLQSSGHLRVTSTTPTLRGTELTGLSGRSSVRGSDRGKIARCNTRRDGHDQQVIWGRDPTRQIGVVFGYLRRRHGEELETISRLHNIAGSGIVAGELPDMSLFPFPCTDVAPIGRAVSEKYSVRGWRARLRCTV